MKVWHIFVTFLRLGLTSFGGPVAHLGYFRQELVVRQRWLEESQYAEVVALAQFLPGPASSQVGLALGLLRGGWLGAAAAWLGFTLPSAALMVLLAVGLSSLGGAQPWLSGLKLAAVAAVAQAVGGMWRTLVTTRLLAGMALGVAVLTLLAPLPLTPLLALLACGLVGWAYLPSSASPAVPLAAPVSPRTGLVLLGSAALGLLVLPLLAPTGAPWQLLDITYRAGALVFGGGHVVLPLLEQGLVPDFVSPQTFMAGYGAANAMPGPLFTFASYLGAAQGALAPLPGALIATLGIFLPGALLMFGALPWWQVIRGATGARSVLAGVNAGVVGLLLAALYQPVFTTTVHAPRDMALALAAYGALEHARLPPWAVVLGCALVTALW